jgi:demethylmenaquinone methyltransferase/2-methoxy-6-polyprenyl-1,4-benzoquinol methylase
VSKDLNKWGQTKDWEEACIDTRRDMKSRKRRLSLFKIKKNEKVLDLGCGDGLNIQALRESGIKNIIGLDISKELLAIARKENKGVKFVQATAEKLPFKANSFDIVLVDSVFHHFLKYEPALKEIKRVLKPGGKLCFIEPHHSMLRSVYDFVSILPISAYIPRLKERRKSYLGEIKFMKNWLRTEDEFYEILKDLKFKEKMKKHDILSIIGIYQKSKTNEL